MQLKIDIESLSDNEKMSLIKQLIKSLDDWQDSKGFFCYEKIVLEFLNKSERQNIIEHLVSKHYKECIKASNYWNIESLEFMGYYNINKDDFLKWLIKNHANCYLTKFSSDDIEVKIKLYIKETNHE